jgi:DNA-binding MarR family transcriptional regulator
VTARSEAAPGALDSLNRGIQAFGHLVSHGRVIEAVLHHARIELSRADLQVLGTLREAGDGIRLGDLAERLQLDAPTVTRRVQQLEGRQLVRRATDPFDKRAQLVQLTAAGNRAVERAKSTFRRWLDGVLVGWSAQEREQFARLLERFIHDVSTAVDCHDH